MGLYSRVTPHWTELSMRTLLAFSLLWLSAGAEDGACFSHIRDKCEAPGDDWTVGECSFVFGGFKGNSNNLHRVIVDDFTDSITYLLMASSFDTDTVNRLGFSKFFMGQSDKMWKRGKDMMKNVLKRGGKMGTGFQIPPLGEGSPIAGGLDFSTEMKGLAVTLDLLKTRASDVYTAYRHSLAVTSKSSPPSFDPNTAHMLEELSEAYAEDINYVASKLNSLGKMVRKANSNAMALHLFDKMLM